MADNTNAARTIGEILTTKQLGMIRAIAREIGIDHNAECQKLLGCDSVELSKRAASDFIEHLQNLQRNKRGI